MRSYLYLKTWNSTYNNRESYESNYRKSHDRGWKTEWKVRPKLTRVEFIFDQGSPASWVELSVLNEVLTSSPRLASQGWIIFDDLRPSYLSIPLRGSCHKLDASFGGVFLSYHRGCKIEDQLRRSSSSLRPGGAPMMMWHSFPIGTRGLSSP